MRFPIVISTQPVLCVFVLILCVENCRNNTESDSCAVIIIDRNEIDVDGRRKVCPFELPIFLLIWLPYQMFAVPVMLVLLCLLADTNQSKFLILIEYIDKIDYCDRVSFEQIEYMITRSFAFLLTHWCTSTRCSRRNWKVFVVIEYSRISWHATTITSSVFDWLQSRFHTIIGQSLLCMRLYTNTWRD